VTGRFQATRQGFGFVTPEAGGAEVFIPAGETHGAFHGDRVEVLVTRDARGTWSAEGSVTRILERGFKRLTGVVTGPARHPLLIPDHPRLPERIRLAGRLAGISAGQRLLCDLHDAGGRAGPAAIPVTILGDADDATQDTAIVETEFGLPGEYPPEAVAEAARARDRLESAAPETGRRDFSGELVLTIDPVDAADFDDAVSVSVLPDGTRRLRVHIADVAEAVARGGDLDREARRRGNSTYLPGRMIPMLPETLATGLMSLSPGAPKRVLSVSIRLQPDGRILGARIDEGRIVSRHRLDYDRVEAMLEQGSGAGELDAALREMDALAGALRRRRFARGAFDLEVPETEIALAPDGYPSDIRRRRQGRSHQLIEEFMIVANRVACSQARRLGHPYLFRVHEPPSPLALDVFREAVRALAPEVRAAQLADLPAIRRWLAGLERGPRTWRIHGLFLRALQRAVYAAADRGHFGLGLRGYGHFTSPIRRYPDLFNHRVVKWALRHSARPLPDAWRAEAAEVAFSSSGTEERSERAERALIRIKCLRWAERNLGSSFRATILGVERAGYAVELDEVPVFGFVPRTEAIAASLGDRRSTRAGLGRGDLTPGQPVIVQIARVVLRERAIVLAIRAAGRRALATDPDSLEAAVDPWGRPTRHPRRSGSRRRGTRR
jgi:ribonuclease R